MIWVIHLVLLLAWGCFTASLFLPSFGFAPPENLVVDGFTWVRLSVIDPAHIPLFGVANAMLVSSPLWFRRAGRRCSGAFAALGVGWSALAQVWGFMLADRPLIGLFAWAFALCLFASWLVMCWMVNRRRPAG